MMHRPNISGRLTRWTVELSEYYIDFIPATTIKGQALTDFIVELTIVNSEEIWVVEVDGSSCNAREGIAI